MSGGGLLVHVHSAFGLPKVDRFGSIDPYVLITFKNVTKGRTRALKNTQEPLWDEKLEIELSLDDEEEGAELVATVFDWNRVTRDKPVASISLPLVEIPGPGASEMIDFELQGAKATRGYLRMLVEWLPTDTEKEEMNNMVSPWDESVVLIVVESFEGLSGGGGEEGGGGMHDPVLRLALLQPQEENITTLMHLAPATLCRRDALAALAATDEQSTCDSLKSVSQLGRTFRWRSREGQPMPMDDSSGAVWSSWGGEVLVEVWEEWPLESSEQCVGCAKVSMRDVVFAGENALRQAFNEDDEEGDGDGDGGEKGGDHRERRRRGWSSWTLTVPVIESSSAYGDDGSDTIGHVTLRVVCAKDAEEVEIDLDAHAEMRQRREEAVLRSLSAASIVRLRGVFDAAAPKDDRGIRVGLAAAAQGGGIQKVVQAQRLAHFLQRDMHAVELLYDLEQEGLVDRVAMMGALYRLPEDHALGWGDFVGIVVAKTHITPSVADSTSTSNLTLDLMAAGEEGEEEQPLESPVGGVGKKFRNPTAVARLAHVDAAFAASKRLGEAATCGTHLCLADLGLLYVPDAVSERTNPFLLELDLSGNRIRSLPPEFPVHLKRLRRLDVSDNALEFLPGSIGGLQALRSLVCRDNRLTELPHQISLVSELEIMDVSNNLLRSQSGIPASFHRLHNLRRCDIHGNPLSEGGAMIALMAEMGVPHLIAYLRAVHEFGVYNPSKEGDAVAALAHVDVIAELRLRHLLPRVRAALLAARVTRSKASRVANLDGLGLGFDDEPQQTVGDGPATVLGDLTAAKSLSDAFPRVDGDQLVSVPPTSPRAGPFETINVTELRELNLSNNPITTLPDAIGSLRGLRRLSASGCALSALPSQALCLRLSECPLTALDLSDNSIVTLHGPSVAALAGCSEPAPTSGGIGGGGSGKAGLVMLDVSHNLLRELPAELALLGGALRVLELAGNPLHDGEEMADLMSRPKGLAKLFEFLSGESFGGGDDVEGTAKRDLIQMLPSSGHASSVDLSGRNLRDWSIFTVGGGGGGGHQQVATRGFARSVVDLDASRNRIDSLPDNLDDFVRLRRLALRENLLSAVPSLSKLAKLQAVDLSKNRLCELPAGIGGLIELRFLDVSRNLLTDLPGSLGGLDGLQTLLIHSNRFALKIKEANPGAMAAPLPTGVIDDFGARIVAADQSSGVRGVLALLRQRNCDAQHSLPPIAPPPSFSSEQQQNDDRPPPLSLRGPSTAANDALLPSPRATDPEGVNFSARSWLKGVRAEIGTGAGEEVLHAPKIATVAGLDREPDFIRTLASAWSAMASLAARPAASSGRGEQRRALSVIEAVALMQGVAKMFLAKRRVHMRRLAEAAAKGDMLATGGTVQGFEGWYQTRGLVFWMSLVFKRKKKMDEAAAAEEEEEAVGLFGEMEWKPVVGPLKVPHWRQLLRHAAGVGVGGDRTMVPCPGTSQGQSGYYIDRHGRCSRWRVCSDGRWVRAKAT